jgi:hypothetical protein
MRSGWSFTLRFKPSFGEKTPCFSVRVSLGKPNGTSARFRQKVMFVQRRPEVRDLFVKALTEIDGEDWSFYCGCGCLVPVVPSSSFPCFHPSALHVHSLRRLVASAMLCGALPDSDNLTAEPAAASSIASVGELRSLLRHFQRHECTKRPPSIVRGPFLAEMLLDCALLQHKYGGSEDAIVPDTDATLAGLVARLIEYIGRIGNSACAFYDVQRMLSPFVLPACWSRAAVSCGGHTIPPSADVGSATVLSLFGLPYPAVDTYNAPLPHKASIPTFTFVASETARTQLWEYLSGLVTEDKRPPANIVDTVGLTGDASASVTEYQQKALAAIRDTFQLYTTAHQVRGLLCVSHPLRCS